jgi:Zn-dependent protease
VLAWWEIGNPTINVLIFILAGWVVSLSLHEFSHALFAYRSGDRSVVDRGYLTLNPLKYTHPLLSIGLPLLFLLLGGIGLPGGAVYVDRHAVHSKVKASLISAAGPAANLAFLLVLLVPFVIGLDTRAHPTFWAAWAWFTFLQLMAVVLNLLPVPGLDGGNIVRPWLSGDAARVFDVVANFGMLIVFAILWTPQLNALFFGFLDLTAEGLGIPSSLWFEGLRLMAPWRYG